MNRQFLWMVPFFSFYSAYLITNFVLSSKTIPAPLLIGKNVTEAACILSDFNLNFRVIAPKEDNDLPHGTIISQSPSHGFGMKAHQALYCTITQKSTPKLAPDFIGKKQNEINKTIQNCGLQNKAYFHNCSFPSNTCIGQIPHQNESLRGKTIITYFAAGSHKPVLFPNLKQLSMSTVSHFLSQHAINPSLSWSSKSHPSVPCNSCKVIDQKPLAGSIINLSELKNIQIHLSCTAPNSPQN